MSVLAFGEARFAEGSPPRRFCHTLIDHDDADVFRLEATAIPVHGFAMLCMSWLFHRVEDVCEAKQTADSLRQHALFAINEARIFDCRIGIRDGFDDDGMPPVVAEVVGIVEGGDAAIDKSADRKIAGRISLSIEVLCSPAATNSRQQPMRAV